jgi:hypothetical protein
MLTIVCTSKPHDGLFYYSCEYLAKLLEQGITANLFVIPHPGYKKRDYYRTISTKYENFSPELFSFDDVYDTILIMGRSMLTLPYLKFKEYDSEEQFMLKMIFNNKLISVYSENHPHDYPKALKFFNPEDVYDLCDTEVYPNGSGEYFEKRINFSIYKTPINDIKYKYIFMGTNQKYYNRILEVIDKYPDCGIITYDDSYIETCYNNLIVPIENLLGIFDTYVYTKNTFDPAPRIVQECKWLNKDIIYERDESLRDGGYVYYHRDLKEPDIEPILKGLKEL